MPKLYAEIRTLHNICKHKIICNINVPIIHFCLLQNFKYTAIWAKFFAKFLLRRCQKLYKVDISTCFCYNKEVAISTFVLKENGRHVR